MLAKHEYLRKWREVDLRLAIERVVREAFVRSGYLRNCKRHANQWMLVGDWPEERTALLELERQFTEGSLKQSLTKKELVNAVSVVRVSFGECCEECKWEAKYDDSDTLPIERN